MKIAVIDTYYEAFRSSFPINQSASYQEELDRVLRFRFGTADFYSHNLRALGHEVIDVIADWRELQAMWSREHYQQAESSLVEIMNRQIELFQPDVVFLQDLSIPLAKGNWLLAGQISCAIPNMDLRKFSCLFSSFPFYVERFNNMGMRAEYLPLAFDPSVLEGPQPERDIDISFVGGVGAHWKQGEDTLEIIAAAFPDRFHAYGYGFDRLPASSALRGCYRGAAWGKEMYSIYRRSKIVLNRHGEISQGYANNLRLFESTGAGAMLVTESAPNLHEFFSIGSEVVTYSKPEILVELLHYYLDDPEGKEWRGEIAERGQRKTLTYHNYERRMKVVSEVLTEMLCAV